MKALSRNDIEHIFESLRKGLVPERGIDAFAVGIEKPRGELHRQLELAEHDDGTIKFLRGGYGCGKTFMARLALLDAQNHDFATSFVVVSDNDLRFHRFDDVYGRVMVELGTSACPRGAIGDILDRWIGRIEDALIATGADEHAPDFDAKVRQRVNEDLLAMTGGRAPEDFIRVIQTIFDLKQEGEIGEAGALISWLCGSANVAASAKKRARIKGDIGSREALEYLRGVLAIIRAADYKGLLIVIDEAETILRMRKDSRHKSLNGIRQIADAAGSYPGLFWLFTGTPEFYDTRQGVAGLAPLDDRIHFKRSGNFTSLRQPQLELLPFDAERLHAVALKLREIFPIEDPVRRDQRVSDAFIERLVRDVTAGFKGDVGVIPRQFLREFVNQLDLTAEHEDYVPMNEYKFEVQELSPEEQQAVSGTLLSTPEDDDELVPAEDSW